MAINDGMFTSNSAEYETPQDFFDELDSEFHFNTDVCATRENAKAAIYFTKEDDGLEKHWNSACWMNPPYGREIGKWIKKAYESARGGATIVCLVPARTDTAWWHDYCVKGEIRFIRGRLKFNNMDSAPFPSAIVIFRPPLLKRLFGG